MRLLVVGHSYVTPFAQGKYVAMKALRRDLSLRLVVPPVVRHPLGSYRPQLATGLAPEELVVIRAFANGSHMSYVFDPVALGSLMREFEPTHVHVEEDPHSAAGFEAVCLASRICPRAVLSFFVWDNLNRTPRFPVSAIKCRLMQFGFSRTRLVICGNQLARSLLAAKGYHGPSEVIPQVGADVIAVGMHAHPMGDFSESIPREREQVPVIGYFGSLVKEKGLEDLFEALVQLSDLPWRLIIAGDGALRSDIENRWQSAFGDRLTCVRPIPHAEMLVHLERLDIFVLPSYTTATIKEQFGLTLAQAMLTGCACIGSSSGAIPEVLGDAGLIFPERNTKALASSLRSLLESAADRSRLGSAASAFARARYTNAVIAGRYLQAFDGIAKQMKPSESAREAG